MSAAGAPGNMSNEVQKMSYWEGYVPPDKDRQDIMDHCQRGFPEQLSPALIPFATHQFGGSALTSTFNRASRLISYTTSETWRSATSTLADAPAGTCSTVAL